MGEDVFAAIDIDFKRNIPEDNSSLVNLDNALKGTVSDATLLSLLPFVDDVGEELERVAEQKAANMAMYSFSTPADDEEETE
jgi:hypothetical protein